MTRYASAQQTDWWKTDNDDQYRNRRPALGGQMFRIFVVVGFGALVALAALGFGIYWLLNNEIPEVLLIAVVLVFIVGLFLIGAVVLMLLFVMFSVGKKYDVKAEPQGEQSVVHTRDNVPLHVEVQNDAGARRTVVFVHGIACSSKMWHHQRNALPGDTRVVVYDARGHGRSGGQKIDHKVPGLRQLADDLGRVIDEKAPTGDLVLTVHSMGGMTMFALAAIRPDIFDRVRGILVLGSSPGPGKKVVWLGIPNILAPVRAIILHFAAPVLAFVGILPGFLLRILGMGPYLLAARWLGVPEDAPREAWRLTARMFYETTPKRYAHHVAAILEHDERPALDRLSSIPMIVVGGDQDQLFRFTTEHEWVKYLPLAEFKAAPGAGHMVPLERPKWVNAQLNSLLVETYVEPVIEAPAPSRKVPHQNVPYMWADYQEEVEAATAKAAPKSSGNTTVELATDLINQIPIALKKILGDQKKD